MNRYASAPLRAFFDRSLYRWAGGEGKGTGFLYLFILLLVCWLLISVKVYFSLADLRDDPEFESFVSQVPPISIEQGQVSADVEQPYTIRSETEPGFVFIIDTTGQITELDDSMEEGGLLTRDRLIMRRNRWETRELDLSQIESFHMDADWIRGWVAPLAAIVALAVALLMPVVSLVYRAIVALVLAAVGQPLANRFKASLDWSGLLRIATLAMTPVIVVDTLASLIAPSAFSGCAWWFVCGAANLAYMIFGLTANRAAPETVPPVWPDSQAAG